MSRSLLRAPIALQGDKVDREQPAKGTTDDKVDRLPAKVKAGAMVKAAIGSDPAKKYGDKGLIANVTSGEKVPGYLAEIVADKQARRRFALALLEDDTDVIVRTVIEFPATKKASNE